MITDTKETAATYNFGALVLGVCGYSGSGKTTLLEAAIPQLGARGLAVAVVKHDAHGFAVDKEGKDSDRLFRAGATVALRGPTEQFMRRGSSASLTLQETLADLAREHDIVLIEGHKETPFPKLWMSSATEASPPECVSDIQEILPWNSDRLSAFHDYMDRWLVHTWRQRQLFAGVLIGGKSRRMKVPKQTMHFGNRTMGEIAAHSLGQALEKGENLLYVPNAKTLHHNLVLLGSGVIPDALLHQRRLLDPPGLAGPLAGLLAGHRWAPSAAWVVSACDHPWLRTEDVIDLLQQRKPGRWAVVSRQRDEHPCPTLALYEPQALNLLERSLWNKGADDTRLAQLLDDPHTWINPIGTDGSEDVNTPHEFMTANDQLIQKQNLG